MQGVRRLLSVLLMSMAANLAGADNPGTVFFEPVRPPRSVQVIAHRGAARQAPENTRPALQRCIEDGFEWAEVDLRRTVDGHHVLVHDEGLAVPGGGRLVVAKHTLAELREVDLGAAFAQRYAGERILTVAEAFAVAKGRLNLYLDCKAVDPGQLAREIRDAGMEWQVVVYDEPTRWRVLAGTKDEAGEIRLMAKWKSAGDPTAWVATNHLAAVELDADRVTPEIVRALHGAGVKVQVKHLDAWDRPESWERSLAAGADWIQTDAAEEVLAYAYHRRVKTPPVKISLHRGANRYAPENTLPAFEKAIRLGMDYVEFDVRTTRDGKYYLLHDSTLDGKTDGQGPIRERTAEEVERISAGVKFGRPYAALRLPTLEDFLKLVAGRIELYFDAKDIPAEVLAAAVERHGMAERTIVYQSPEYLARLRELNPRIRALPPLGAGDDLAALAARLQPYAVDADWSILSAEMIARCHALGIRVFSDALGKNETVENYRRAIGWGLDVIQTDHPLRVLRALELEAAGSRR